MTIKEIDQLLYLIGEAVSGGEPYAEKCDAILARCNDEMRIQLEEFVSWFGDA